MQSVWKDNSANIKQFYHPDSIKLIQLMKLQKEETSGNLYSQIMLHNVPHSSAALAALRSTLRSTVFPVILVYIERTSRTVDSKCVVAS